MDRISTKVLVVGGGPGGYVAAIRAGQLGLETTLVEADRLGGTCLVRGCIPSKALIHVADRFASMTEASHGGGLGIRLPGPPSLDLGEAIGWKDGIVDKLSGGVGALLRRAKVRVVQGTAVFSDAKNCTVETREGTVAISAENVILASGSVPVELPSLPYGGPVISSTEALALQEIPKRLVVVGAGYIGLELGTAFHKMGAEVTVVEARDRILPIYDEQLTQPVQRWLDKAGVRIHLNALALGVESRGNEQGLKVRTAEGEEILLPADRVLVTVGRRPRTEGWGLERMAVDMAGPFVKVDEQCRTSTRGVYAIGDLVGEPMLAHKASAQGEMVAELIAGKQRRFEHHIPSVCFTEPEIVSVGLMPAEAEKQGIPTKVGVFPFSANGRAMTLEAGDGGGFVRMVARADTHRLVGIQAVGAHVSEMSNQFVHMLEMGSVLEDVAGTVFFHPSLGEAVHEAALRTLGHALHI